MRILALADRWSRGGVPAVIRNHHKMVTETGGEYRLFSYYEPDFEAPELPEWAEHGSARFRGDPGTIRQLFRLLKTFNPDVIHDHFGGFWAACYLYRKKWAQRSLLHYHNEYLPVEDTPDQNRSWRDRIFFKNLLPRFAMVLTVSEHNRDRLIQYAGLAPDRIQTLPNSIDPEAFGRPINPSRTVRNEFSIPDEALVLGTHGRLVYEKGMDTTIEVLAELIHSDTGGLPVWGIISGSGDYRFEERLQAMVKKFGIQDRVVFTGYRKDVPEILKAMDLFLMPSRQEPFGLAILEAMTMQVPVVAVRPEQGGGPLEIIEDGCNGIIAESRNAAELAKICLSLLNDNEQRKRLTEQALKDLHRFHPESIGQKLINIYRELGRGG